MLRNLAAQKEQQQVLSTSSPTSNLNTFQQTTITNGSIYEKLRILNNSSSCWSPRSPNSRISTTGFVLLLKFKYIYSNILHLR